MIRRGHHGLRIDLIQITVGGKSLVCCHFRALYVSCKKCCMCVYIENMNGYFLIMNKSKTH